MRFGDVQRQNRKVKLLLLACVSAVVILSGVIAYLLIHGNGSASAKPSDTKAESQSVVKAVGKLYIIPTDESPTVAAIQDKTKLSGQAFFKDARNGDYVLVYAKAKTALLYRKSINKLVNVGPINLGNNATGTQSTGQ